jgi:hypothetical protein
MCESALREAKKDVFQPINVTDSKMKATWSIVKTETETKCHPGTKPSVLTK